MTLTLVATPDPDDTPGGLSAAELAVLDAELAVLEAEDAYAAGPTSIGRARVRRAEMTLRRRSGRRYTHSTQGVA